MALRLRAPLLALALLACREPAAPAAERSSQPKVQDRLELVLQPRGGWLPEAAPRRLSLQLLSEKTSIRAGEPFGYRLEMRNTGRDALVFKEASPSFIKEGSLCGPDFRFYAAAPGRSEALVPCEPSAPTPEGGLELVLRSGEYLRTRPAGKFRPLRTPLRFDRAGTYRLRVEYAAGGLVSKSEPVRLEVIP